MMDMLDEPDRKVSEEYQDLFEIEEPIEENEEI